LPKAYRRVKFGDTIDTVKIIGVEYDEDDDVEVVKVIVHPMTDDEFYAELYMEDLGEWNFVD
jgi:bifunctional DNase/RNase